MIAQDPNRYSWQGIYSWNEPVVGSRREWKSDHWRFGKIAACLVPVILLCALFYGSINWLFVECMAGVVVFTYTYLWIFTFFPRRIVLFEDRISIFRGGSRGTSAAVKVSYSDVKQMKVISENQIFRIELTLTSGREVSLYSRDTNPMDSLNRLLKGVPDNGVLTK